MPTFEDAIEGAINALVPAGTRPFTFDGFALFSDKPVVLHSKHAGTSNAAYTAAQFRAYGAQRRQGGKMTPERAEANRLIEAKLLAKYVTTGWDNVNEAPGASVPFSAAKAEWLLSLLAKKRPDLFVMYANYIGDADNFRDEPMGDPEELGK